MLYVEIWNQWINDDKYYISLMKNVIYWILKAWNFKIYESWDLGVNMLYDPMTMKKPNNGEAKQREAILS